MRKLGPTAVRANLAAGNGGENNHLCRVPAKPWVAWVELAMDGTWLLFSGPLADKVSRPTGWTKTLEKPAGRPAVDPLASDDAQGR